MSEKEQDKKLKQEERDEAQRAQAEWQDVDDLSEQSFPASDPPSFTPGRHTGCPPEKEPRKRANGEQTQKP